MSLRQPDEESAAVGIARAGEVAYFSGISRDVPFALGVGLIHVLAARAEFDDDDFDAQRAEGLRRLPQVFDVIPKECARFSFGGEEGIQPAREQLYIVFK